MGNRSNASYRRYAQYRANRQQYKVDQVAAPIVAMIFIGIFTKYIGLIIIASVLVAIVCVIVSGIISSKSKEIEEVENVCINKKSIEDYNRNEKVVSSKVTGGNIMKSTESGYVNKNNQRNNGRSSLAGTDHMQWFYNLECLNCGCTYLANGSDIWQRKCPHCQGGKK